MSGTKVVVKNGTFYAWYLFSASNGINAVKLLGWAHFLKQRSSEHSLSVIKRSFLCLSCVKVKVYLVTASRDIRGVEVKPHSCVARHWMESSGQLCTLVALFPGQSPGNHWIVYWPGPRACLNGFGEETIRRPYRGSKPGPSSPWVVSILSALSWLFNRPC